VLGATFALLLFQKHGGALQSSISMELSRRFRARLVSGATKLQQVKIRTCEQLA
jgi:hypothetical protein